MKIIVDTREQAPYEFSSYGVEVVPGTLPTGDYSLPRFEDVIAVERKSLPDFIGSISSGRERFEREMRRAMILRHFKVVVEATMEQICTGDYLSKMNPKAVRNTVISWQQRFGVHFCFCATRAGAEYETFHTLRLFHERIEKDHKQAVRGQA